MTIKKQKQIDKFFTGISAKYDLVNHLLSFYLDLSWRKKLAKMLLKDTQTKKKTNARILDLASGSGDLALAIQKTLKDKIEFEIICSDINAEMLENARKKGLKNIHISDATNLEFDENSFDYITIAFGLRNIQPWQKGLSEMLRTLKPSGKIFVLDFTLPKNSIAKKLHLFYLNNFVPAIGGAITGNRQAYRYLADSIQTFDMACNQKKFCNEIANLNGEVIHIQPLNFGIVSICSIKVI